MGAEIEVMMTSTQVITAVVVMMSDSESFFLGKRCVPKPRPHVSHAPGHQANVHKVGDFKQQKFTLIVREARGF